MSNSRYDPPAHIDLFAVEYSLEDATTTLKHGNEVVSPYLAFDIKSIPYLGIASTNLSCELLTDKTNLL